MKSGTASNEPRTRARLVVVRARVQLAGILFVLAGQSCTGDVATSGLQVSPDSSVGAGEIDAGPPLTCSDQRQDGVESDVDCGGTACEPCADGLRCLAATDCVSRACTSGNCTPPATVFRPLRLKP